MRRQRNRSRLVGALQAAVDADQWIGTPLRYKSLPESLSIDEPEIVEDLLFDRRRSQLLPDLVPALLRLFRDRPELGAWLRSQEDLMRLARLAGAAHRGGALRTFLERHQVERIVERLGVGVWHYALEKGPDAFILASEVDDIIDAIEQDGRRNVATYLRSVTPDVFPMVMDAMGEDWGDMAADETPLAGTVDRVHAILAEAHQ